MNQKDKFQKEKERFLITGLLKKLKIRDEDVSFSTWPDFIINYEGKKIGLEFTECHSLDIESNHKKGVAKTQDALHDLLNTYKEIILKRGEKSKLIFVTFEDCIYDVLRINKIANTIIDEIDAYRMLSRLNNNTHKVISGVAIIYQDKEIRFIETSYVTFNNLTEKELKDYIATKDPLDKAGAYGIQNPYINLVKKYEGEYENIVGLPIKRLKEELKKL